MLIFKKFYSPKILVSMIAVLLNRYLIPAAFIICGVVLAAGVPVASAQENPDDAEFTQGTETTPTEETAEDPVELFNRAQEAHAAGDLETALKLYQDALRIMPEFPEAEFQRGTIYLFKGNISDAEEAFRKAIELKRDWTLPIAELGALLVRKGEYIEAEEQLNKAIRLNNMSFPAYVALTELKIRTKASTEELKILLGKLQYLTTKAKIPASIWASRGAVERILGDPAAAKISIGRALESEPRNTLALSEAAELALLEGDTQGALRKARSLAELYPHSNHFKTLLARALHADGRSAEAVKVLDAIKEPDGEITVLKNAIALSGSDDIGTLKKMLESDPRNAAALGRLCILSRAENPAGAIEYCRAALEIEPGEINHAIGYGGALVQLKKYPEAVLLFRKLLELSPENYTIRANLATALFQQERFEEAKKEYEWITRREPDLAVAYYFLAISHDNLEEYLDAMANYQQFLRLADDSLKLEIEKVNLRMPILQKQIRDGQGKKRR
jgi:tetratricopeptide (TPR) repeat protein